MRRATCSGKKTRVKWKTSEHNECHLRVDELSIHVRLITQRFLRAMGERRVKEWREEKKKTIKKQVARWKWSRIKWIHLLDSLDKTLNLLTGVLFTCLPAVCTFYNGSSFLSHPLFIAIEVSEWEREIKSIKYEKQQEHWKWCAGEYFTLIHMSYCWCKMHHLSSPDE